MLLSVGDEIKDTISAEDSAKQLLDIILNIKKEDNGKFISYSKNELPW